MIDMAELGSNESSSMPGPQCVKDATSAVCNPNELKRTIGWKQGLFIALGVPLLILPSIGYTASYLWGSAVILWGLSVFQGFMQNLAYGEMATAFPKASGLPGFAQAVFTDRNNKSKYDRGRFIGAFSAWGYWFAWNPVLAIFSLTIASYLQGLVPQLAELDYVLLALLVGAVIFSSLLLINSRGISQGAKIGLILALFSLVPLIVITLAPFVSGTFELSNVTGAMVPDDWAWDMHHILIILGLFGIAQWSACAWETAAIYGPQYKRPGSDVPKALFGCGIVCLFTFIVVQLSVTGVLGVEGVINESVSPLLPVANATFGQAGGTVMIIMLVAAMVLIIQTAFLGSATAMQSMAAEGNLPGYFAKLNTKGVPVRAMVLIALFNMLLITLKTPTAILAASAMGYTCANGISLFAFWKARTDPKLAILDRPFKAPKPWKYVAMVFGLFNMPLCLIGIIYLNGMEFGSSAIVVGAVVLASFVPIWLITQIRNHKGELIEQAREAPIN